MNFTFEPFPEITTARLKLRDYCEGDYTRVFFLRSDPEVTKFIKREHPKAVEDAIDFVKKVQNSMADGANVNWAICQHDKPEMIGSICLWNFSKDLKTGEIGYDLHPAFQNKGFMNEAFQAVLGFGFKTLKLNNIKAYTHHANENSINLLKKNGFVILAEEKDPDNEDNIILSLSHREFL